MSAAVDALLSAAYAPLQLTETPKPATERDKTLERLEADLTELWGHINAANYRFLKLLAEFDRLKGYEAHGLVNCAQWLNWQCGVSDNAAREKVRVARALEFLPKISDAFREGRLSYSKVRAITRVARPEDEEILLQAALHGTAAHVERLVRTFRRCELREETEEANERHRRRYLNVYEDEDGSVVIHAVLEPEVGALVRQAIEAAVEQIDEPPAAGAAAADSLAAEPGDAESGNAEAGDVDSGDAGSVVQEASAPIQTESNVSAETPVSAATPFAAPPLPSQPFSAKRADALRLLAESYLTRRTDRLGSVADRHQVVVHIDQRLLSAAAPADRAEPSPVPSPEDDPSRRCEIDGSGSSLAVETARRLGCDASLVGIVDGARGEPLDVGRKTRAIPPPVRRALSARDGGCRFPGCGRTRFTEGHHVIHWADGGETTLDNLVTLCRHHHRLVHEGGFGLEARADCAGRERFVFYRPDGSRVEPNGRLPAVGGGPNPRADASNARPHDVPPTLFELNRRAGLEIDAGTSRCQWFGEAMDLGTLIECMQWRLKYERSEESVRYDAQRRRRERERARDRAESRRGCCRC